MKTTAAGFAAYFQRVGHDALEMAFNESLDESLFCEPPVDGLLRWSPQPAAGTPDWPAVGPHLSAAALEYFSTTWFLFIGGAFAEHQLILDPIAPKYLPSIESRIERYWREHEDQAIWIPIGEERVWGDRLVLSNRDRDPAIGLEDASSGRVEIIAKNPYRLLSELEPL